MGSADIIRSEIVGLATIMDSAPAACLRDLETDALRALDLHDLGIVHDDLHDAVAHGSHIVADSSEPGSCGGDSSTDTFTSPLAGAERRKEAMEFAIGIESSCSIYK